MILKFESNNTITFIPKSIDYAQWDQAFTAVYSAKQLITLQFDLTQLEETPKVGQLLGMKHVLDAHRTNTKKYLKESKIILNNKLLANTLRCALPLLKPEKPVTII